MEIPIEFLDQISSARPIQERERTYDIVALHCHYMIVRTPMYAKGAPKAVWIAITDPFDKVIYESFVNYKNREILREQTEIHGLDHTDLRYSMNLTIVRRQVMWHLTCAKKIVGAGLKCHLDALEVPELDQQKLYPKMRDLTYAYSPRRNRQPFSMRFTFYLMFKRTIVKNRRHSAPEAEAKAAMWLYLIGKDYIEEEAEYDLQQQEYSGIRGIITCRSNKMIARKLKKMTEEVRRGERSWPRVYERNPLTGQKVELPKFDTEIFVDPDEPRRSSIYDEGF